MIFELLADGENVLAQGAAIQRMVQAGRVSRHRMRFHAGVKLDEYLRAPRRQPLRRNIGAGSQNGAHFPLFQVVQEMLEPTEFITPGSRFEISPRRLGNAHTIHLRPLEVIQHGVPLVAGLQFRVDARAKMEFGDLLPRLRHRLCRDWRLVSVAIRDRGRRWNREERFSDYKLPRVGQEFPSRWVRVLGMEDGFTPSRGSSPPPAGRRLRDQGSGRRTPGPGAAHLLSRSQAAWGQRSSGHCRWRSGSQCGEV